MLPPVRQAKQRWLGLVVGVLVTAAFLPTTASAQEPDPCLHLADTTGWRETYLRRWGVRLLLPPSYERMRWDSGNFESLDWQTWRKEGRPGLGSLSVEVFAASEAPSFGNGLSAHECRWESGDTEVRVATFRVRRGYRAGTVPPPPGFGVLARFALGDDKVLLVRGDSKDSIGHLEQLTILRHVLVAPDSWGRR